MIEPNVSDPAKEAVKEAYRIMRAAYPRWAQQQDRELAKAWESLLIDVPPVKLVESVTTLSKSSKWPPTVAEIREAAGCLPPGVAERRAASEVAAANHERWAEEVQRRATEEARRRIANDAGLDSGERDINKILGGIGS